MPHVIREITIEADAGTVSGFVSRVPNLPEWTTFFRAVGPEIEGRYVAETILGPTETWTEAVADPPGTRLEICSLIAGREERASVDVTPSDPGVAVRFTVTLPDELGPEAVAEQYEEMGDELARLKDLVEAGHANA